MSNRCNIVAETGAAHGKSYARCVAMIHQAHYVGADAVKFSAFKPDEMTLDSDESPFIIESGPWAGRTLYSLYEETVLPYEWIPDLRRAAHAVDLDFIVSVYHPHTVPLLREWGCSTVKVASFEITYLDLLEAIAKESYIQSVILSTGGADLSEILAAVEILHDKKLTLLYCISSYPTEPKDMNLNSIHELRTWVKNYTDQIGLSDHSTGLTAPVMAVVMGAVMIEKHLKLDDDNLDASFAVFPDRFKAMVDVCRQAEDMMGQSSFEGKKTYHRKEIDGKVWRVVW